VGTAQAPYPAPDGQSIVGIASTSEGRPATRILRLEYQLRILAVFHANGPMVVHTVFPGGPATRLVTAGSPATPGELERGDVITHVDGLPIRSQSDYYRAMYLSGARNGQVTIRVRDVRTGRYIVWKATAEKVGGDHRPQHDPVRATRVKALVIGMTNDRGLGAGISKNIQGLTSILRGLPNFDPRTDLTLLTGDVRAKDILRAVSEMRVGPTETLFCYFAGHGAHDSSLAAGDPSGGHFFHLPGGDLMRKALLGQLKSRGAQLTVLLSDTCNVSGKPTLPNIGDLEPLPVRSRVFRELLCNYAGVVDVSGSSRGQFGWYTPDGGWFTLGLLETLHGWGEERDVSWQGFLAETSKNASATFHRKKEMILAQPEPKDEEDRQTRKLLADQPDQRPQTFQLEVKAVKR
jgi:hypothetical protein